VLIGVGALLDLGERMFRRPSLSCCLAVSLEYNVSCGEHTQSE
jgi:hypothetical protein